MYASESTGGDGLGLGPPALPFPLFPAHSALLLRISDTTRFGNHCERCIRALVSMSESMLGYVIVWHGSIVDIWKQVYVMLCYSYCSPTLTVINSHECANGLILCALQ